MDWAGQVDKVGAKCRKRLYSIKAFFPRRFGMVKQLLFKSLVRSVIDYASSSWHTTGKGLQKKLENIQKKFLQSIRLGCLEGNERHDADFAQYRQHLGETGWHPLWQRRLEGILLNTYKIWKDMFAGGDLIMKREMPGRTTKSQSKDFLLSPVSFTPASCKPLDSTIASFAYVAAEILKDPLFSPSPGQLLTLGAFKNYLLNFKFSNLKWCKDFIDPLLVV
ncbi:hypothetical protein RvY_01022 [Ramazzottius varieornatus]|uniref:Reverse transcriptase domain-containing protein n=1 Tax=Ramazzottius varieornatus TaxID=947166 RepID=A0A1D1UEU8_RAMVA|nr:hypothetical protein RvY_01022 [Ramazzottius varieornatus]